VLFTGDVEEPAQTELLRDHGAALDAVLLKVPHHGGDTNLEAFLRATGATVAVVSVGQPNRYGHPSPAALADLAGEGMRVLRTDQAGDVTVRFAPDGLLVRSADG
jgi:competence protein ComEC